MTRAAGFLLVCAFLLSLCSLVAADAASDFLTVNGVSVSQDAFCQRLEGVKIQTTKDGEKVSIPAGEYTIRQCVQEMLVTQLAEKEHVTPTPEQIQDKVDFAKRSSSIGLEAQLKLQGITEEEWRGQIKLQQCLINLLTKGITVSDTEAKADYDTQLKSGTSPFKKGEAVNFSVIVCADKAKADKVYKRLEAGEEFSALAKELSEDKSTAPDGGQVGWLTADMTAAPEIIRLTAFGTAVGKYSKPVFMQEKDSKAWVIIKVTEKRPEQLQSFDEVKGLVKEQIATKKADRKAFEKMLSDFVASSKIDVSAARFKDLPASIKKEAITDANLAHPAVSATDGK